MVDSALPCVEIAKSWTNTGNFLEALQMIASNHEDILKQHLDNTQLSCRNITYISPLIENVIIEIIGQNIKEGQNERTVDLRFVSWITVRSYRGLIRLLCFALLLMKP